MTITIGCNKETCGYDRNLVFKYTREYWCTHEPSDSSRAILASPAVPQPFETHPNDPFAYVENVSINRNVQDGNKRSTITVTYTTQLEREEEQSQEDPLARPARITWGTQNERVPIIFDKDDNPIINDAGDLLLGVEEDRALWVISVTKNVAAVPTWVTSYQNAVNSDAVVIGGALISDGLLKMDSISISELKNENGVFFYEISFQMLFRQDGWDQKLLNVGLREKVTVVDWVTETTTTEIRPILTASGEQVDEPVFLGSNGEAIRGNGFDPDTLIQPLKTDLSPSEIITKTYSTKQTQPFNLLPLS